MTNDICRAICALLTLTHGQFRGMNNHQFRVTTHSDLATTLRLWQELLYGMLCGHTFHDYCVTSYCEARGCGIYELPCPICRFTAEQCQAVEDAASAPAASAAPLADGGQISDEDIAAHQSQDESLVAVEPALVAALPAIVAGPPAKSKANAKAKAGSGPPAKAKAKATAKAKARAAVMAGSGPPAKAEAKATAKSAGSGPPAKAEAKATAKSAAMSAAMSAAFARSMPPAKAEAKATAKSAGSGPPATAEAKATAKSAGAAAGEMIDAALAAADLVGAALAAADEMIDAALPAIAKAGGLGAYDNAVGDGNGKGDGKGKDKDKGGAMFGEYVRCRSCNRFEHYQKCRILGKQSMHNAAATLWRCSGCHVKTTQLYRQFGKWPTTEFEALQEDVKQAFMASLVGMDGPGAVAKATELFETYRVDEEVYKDGGDFLPLSVWEKQGWDTSRVAEFSPAADKKWHSVLGGHVMQ
jgi:hypothetical protein